jgi:molecular chaperone GrpE
MYEIPDPTLPAGTVAQVVEAGYMIADRVLRPARVGVTAGGPTPDGLRQADDPAGTPDAAALPPTDEAAREALGRAAAGAGRHEAPQPEKIGVKIDRSA